MCKPISKSQKTVNSRNFTSAIITSVFTVTLKGGDGYSEIFMH